jgi:hypothetical protein
MKGLLKNLDFSFLSMKGRIPATNSNNNLVKRRTGKAAKDARHTVTLSAYGLFVTTAGGVFAQNYAFTVPNDINGAALSVQDWTSFASVFDSYKVNWIEVEFIPKYPNDTSTVTASAAIAITCDVDTSGTSPSAMTTIIEHEKYTIVSPLKRWRYKCKVPIYTSANTASVVGDGGFLDIADVPATGSILVYGSGLNTSATYGELFYRYNITFANRR